MWAPRRIFLLLNLVVRKVTARLEKVNLAYLGTGQFYSLLKYHNMKYGGVKINFHTNFTTQVDGSEQSGLYFRRFHFSEISRTNIVWVGHPAAQVTSTLPMP
jgi:hypothetical protein